MNKEKTKAAIAVMQAYVDGAEIECCPVEDCVWEFVRCPVWNWYRYDYRVKPTPRTFFAVDYSPGRSVASVNIGPLHEKRDSAEQVAYAHSSSARVIELREVV